MLGCGLVATRPLLMRRRRSAVSLYAVVLMAMAAWSVDDIGFDWLPLASRLDVVFLLGLWLLTPWITSPLRADAAKAARPSTLSQRAGIEITAVVLLFAAEPDHVGECEEPAGRVDLPHRRSGGQERPDRNTFDVTPIKVRDMLYLCSQNQRLFALDARSG